MAERQIEQRMKIRDKNCQGLDRNRKERLRDNGIEMEIELHKTD